MPRAVERVSTHALTRRATRTAVATGVAVAEFQPTPSRGGRRPSPRPSTHSTRPVSTHALTRRATRDVPLRAPPFHVSTHALTRRATAWCASSATSVAFQPTPSRGGRRGDLFRAMCDRYVSTHALTRRATRGVYAMVGAGIPVSTHALTRRATLAGMGDGRGIAGFNPRPHAEGDSGTRTPGRCRSSFNPRPHAEGDETTAGWPTDAGWVSTHALTRRATHRDGQLSIGARRFNPRPHAEGDEPLRPSFRDAPLVSTHALTRRATQPKARRAIAACCFNPRPHAEGDMTTYWLSYGGGVFQPTPSRGGRPGAPIGATNRLCTFQPTPSRGGRPGAVRVGRRGCGVSTHALTRRATSGGVGALLLGVFQPTPSRGGRRRAGQGGRSWRSSFQPTPSRGGRRPTAAAGWQPC